MAVFYCEVCDRYIDLDYDVEHYERCPTLPDPDEAEEDAVQEMGGDDFAFYEQATGKQIGNK